MHWVQACQPSTHNRSKALQGLGLELLARLAQRAFSRGLAAQAHEKVVQCVLHTAAAAELEENATTVSSDKRHVRVKSLGLTRWARKKASECKT